MIPISKNEAEMLREKNLGNYVKHTLSKKKHYYCVEAEKPLRKLKEYREQIILESKTTTK